MLVPQSALSAPVGVGGAGASGDLSRTVPLTVAGEATLTTLYAASGLPITTGPVATSFRVGGAFNRQDSLSDFSGSATDSKFARDESNGREDAALERLEPVNTLLRPR